ncbi:MAG: gluconokinase [Micromonosporaceae bacterium]|nr:gluconokinase [Micromonosporaceae bacterium]
MGVAGAGKSTVAALLGERLRWSYAEADDLHPRANIDKMAAGVPLDDEDREPWLRAVRDWLSLQPSHTVVACSALRRSYRDILREASGRVRFVHLSGEPHLVAQRVEGREGHFWPAGLLPSQYHTLEPLAADEDGVTVDINAPPSRIVQQVVDWLSASPNDVNGRSEPTSGPAEQP